MHARGLFSGLKVKKCDRFDNYCFCEVAFIRFMWEEYFVKEGSS